MPFMTVSFVFRLIAATETDGIAGRIEVVETGETAVVKDAEALVEFVRRVCRDSVRERN